MSKVVPGVGGLSPHARRDWHDRLRNADSVQGHRGVMECSRQIRNRVRLHFKKLLLDQRWRLRPGPEGDWRGPWPGSDQQDQQ